MSSSHLRKPEPCAQENCGSRRFHEGDDGFTYCDRGHQQSERGTLVSQDTGELRNTGRRLRRRDSDAESNTSRASGFSGSKALEHYLLCLQLILRRQLRWLIEVQKLPEELEAIVRDLWTLRLQRLQTRISYDSETETETQYFSSQSEGETSASTHSKQSRSARAAASVDGNTPNILDVVTLSYISVLLLREPVTVADVYSWVKDGELLYYQAAKEVPLGMRERLPPAYQELLEPQPLGSPERLQQHVIASLTKLSAEYGMSSPAINHPLVLYRWLQELALPIEVFPATTRLARLQDVEFAWETRSEKGKKDVVLRYPEARLMAIVVVTTKLLFPLDDIKRYPTSARDMTALAMDWKAWSELQTTRSTEWTNGGERLGYAEAMNLSQSEVLKAADDRLDDYMDWLERNVTTEDVRQRGQAGREANFRRALFGMFPASGDDTHPPLSSAGIDQAAHLDVVQERLRQSQGMLRPKRIIEFSADDEYGVALAGSFYRRFRSSDDLDGPAKVLYQRAAELAAISIESMTRAVFLTERRLQRHEEVQRKATGDEGSLRALC